MDDSQIIDLFLERSEQAITEVSDKYKILLNKVAFNILNNELDAQECVNDTYLGLWNSIPPKNPHSLIAYACRIVRNLSIKKYYSNTATKRNSFFDIALGELEDCISSNSSVEKEYEEAELGKIVDDFLDSLDTNNRIMFMRRYWFSDSLSEIAKMFGITEHNAAVRLSCIRAKMKMYFTKRGV